MGGSTAPGAAATAGRAGAWWAVSPGSYTLVLMLLAPAVAAAQDVALAYFIAKAIFLDRRGPVAFLILMAIVSDAIGIASIRSGRGSRSTLSANSAASGATVLRSAPYLSR